MGRRLSGSVLCTLLVLVAAPSALAQPQPSTPGLIQRAENAGRLDRSKADLFRAYAIAEPARLPDAYRSDAPWDGTLTLLQVRHDLPRLREAERQQIQALLAAAPSTASCDTESSVQANVQDTTHFHITYDGVDAGLSAAQYGTSLEQAWAKEVDSFGWAAPPVYTPEPAPGNRYHVRIDELGPGLYGFVSHIGTHAGLVGDNPATAWNEGDAYASCMVLNRDYSGFPSTPQASLDSTTAHEFNHSIQYGYGTLIPFGATDEVFVEGGATWMEDEVQDAADDNYHYLWPDFGESMGDYDPPGFPYPYWITFRGFTERYGTGASGGGEDVMQEFWELTSRNLADNQNAMASALQTRGTTLADAFHAYAVAVKFNAVCDGAHIHPYCFEEAAGYLSAAGATQADASIATVGGSASSSVEDNYALSWVTLPPGSGEYNVTLENRSSGGQLRGTVACDTGMGLRLGPLPQIVAAHASTTFVGFDAAGCTARALVVTNQSQTASNPNNSSSRSFTVGTAPASPGAHTLAVTRSGSGNGSVTSNPAGINCPGDCQEAYGQGTTVTLTPSPAAGSRFAGWSGAPDCTRTLPCTVTLNASRSVTAVFKLLADNTPPQTAITGGPSGQTSDSTPTFAFTSSEGLGPLFTCQVDSGPATACESGFTTGALPAGSHTFSVYATSADGTGPTATRAFTVTAADTGSPGTTIPGGTTSGNITAGDVIAPVISRLRLSPTRFRAALRGAPMVAAVGTRLSLTLSEASAVTFRVSRLAPGRRVNGRCVRPTSLNRAAPRCTRTVRLGGRIVRQLAAGTTRLHYRGRLAGRRLSPGRYVLTARARDAAGNRSAVRRAGFRIVR